jgi:plastocyanin
MGRSGKIICSVSAVAGLGFTALGVGVGGVTASAASKSHSAPKPVALPTSIKDSKLVKLNGTTCTYNPKSHALAAGGTVKWVTPTGSGAQGTITVTWTNGEKGKKGYTLNQATGSLFEGPWSLSTQGTKAVTHCTLLATFTAPTASSVEAVFAAAGLPISGLITFNATTDPNHLLGRPTGYASKDAWQDGRIDQTEQGTDVGGVEFGGGIEVFPTSAGAQSRANYLGAIQSASSLFGSEYDYTLGPILVRISGTLTPTQAATYQAVIPEFSLFHYVPTGAATTTTTTP